MLQFPSEYTDSFTSEEREQLHRAMQTRDIQSLPQSLVTKTRAAFRAKDARTRREAPVHNHDVHTRSLRGLPVELR